MADEPRKLPLPNYDGDTVQAAQRFRVGGIDTPEMDEVGGPEAKSFLQEFKPTDARAKTEDTYGRQVGELRDAQGKRYAPEAVRQFQAVPERFKGQRDPEIDAADIEARQSLVRRDPKALAAVSRFTSETTAQRQYRAQNLKDAVTRRREKMTLGQEFGEGVRRGIDTTQAGLYGAVSLVGNAVGSEGMEQFGAEGYQRNMQEAQQHAGTHTFKDATDEGAAALGRWAMGALGEALPTIGSMFVGGGAGGVAGVAARTAGRRIIGRRVTAALARRARRMGIRGADATLIAGRMVEKLPQYAAKVGAVGTSTAQQSGSVFEEIREKFNVDAPGTAAIAGGIMGSLDAFGAFGLLDQVLGTASKGIVSSIVTNLGLGALREGTTEAAQELTAAIAEQSANPDVNSLDGLVANVMTDETKWRIMEAAAAGAVFGGVAGAGSGAVQSIRGTLDQEQQTPDAQPESAQSAPEQPGPAPDGATGPTGPGPAPDGATGPTGPGPQPAGPEPTAGGPIPGEAEVGAESTQAGPEAGSTGGTPGESVSGRTEEGAAAPDLSDGIVEEQADAPDRESISVPDSGRPSQAGPEQAVQPAAEAASEPVAEHTAGPAPAEVQETTDLAGRAVEPETQAPPESDAQEQNVTEPVALQEKQDAPQAETQAEPEGAGAPVSRSREEAPAEGARRPVESERAVEEKPKGSEASERAAEEPVKKGKDDERPREVGTGTGGRSPDKADRVPGAGGTGQADAGRGTGTAGGKSGAVAEQKAPPAPAVERKISKDLRTSQQRLARVDKQIAETQELIRTKRRETKDGKLAGNKTLGNRFSALQRQRERLVGEIDELQQKLRPAPTPATESAPKTSEVMGTIERYRQAEKAVRDLQALEEAETVPARKAAYRRRIAKAAGVQAGLEEGYQSALKRHADSTRSTVSQASKAGKKTRRTPIQYTTTLDGKPVERETNVEGDLIEKLTTRSSKEPVTNREIAKLVGETTIKSERTQAALAHLTGMGILEETSESTARKKAYRVVPLEQRFTKAEVRQLHIDTMKDRLVNMMDRNPSMSLFAREMYELAEMPRKDIDEGRLARAATFFEETFPGGNFDQDFWPMAEQVNRAVGQLARETDQVQRDFSLQATAQAYSEEGAQEITFDHSPIARRGKRREQDQGKRTDGWQTINRAEWLRNQGRKDTLTERTELADALEQAPGYERFKQAMYTAAKGNKVPVPAFDPEFLDPSIMDAVVEAQAKAAAGGREAGVFTLHKAGNVWKLTETASKQGRESNWVWDASEGHWSTIEDLMDSRIKLAREKVAGIDRRKQKKEWNEQAVEFTEEGDIHSTDRVTGELKTTTDRTLALHAETIRRMGRDLNRQVNGVADDMSNPYDDFFAGLSFLSARRRPLTVKADTNLEGKVIRTEFKPDGSADPKRSRTVGNYRSRWAQSTEAANKLTQLQNKRIWLEDMLFAATKTRKTKGGQRPGDATAVYQAGIGENLTTSPRDAIVAFNKEAAEDSIALLRDEGTLVAAIEKAREGVQAELAKQTANLEKSKGAGEIARKAIEKAEKELAGPNMTPRKIANREKKIRDGQRKQAEYRWMQAKYQKQKVAADIKLALLDGVLQGDTDSIKAAIQQQTDVIKGLDEKIASLSKPAEGESALSSSNKARTRDLLAAREARGEALGRRARLEESLAAGPDGRVAGSLEAAIAATDNGIMQLRSKLETSQRRQDYRTVWETAYGTNSADMASESWTERALDWEDRQDRKHMTDEDYLEVNRQAEEGDAAASKAGTKTSVKPTFWRGRPGKAMKVLTDLSKHFGMDVDFTVYSSTDLQSALAAQDIDPVNVAKLQEGFNQGRGAAVYMAGRNAYVFINEESFGSREVAQIQTQIYEVEGKLKLERNKNLQKQRRGEQLDVENTPAMQKLRKRKANLKAQEAAHLASYDKWFQSRVVPDLGHEFGHVLFRSQLQEQQTRNTEVWQRLTKAYEQSGHIDMEEWFADQVATWVRANKKPSNLLEAFYQKAARIAQKVVDWMTGQKAATMTVQSLLDGMVLRQQGKSYRDLRSALLTNFVDPLAIERAFGDKKHNPAVPAADIAMLRAVLEGERFKNVALERDVAFLGGHLGQQAMSGLQRFRQGSSMLARTVDVLLGTGENFIGANKFIFDRFLKTADGWLRSQYNEQGGHISAMSLLADMTSFDAGRTRIKGRHQVSYTDEKANQQTITLTPGNEGYLQAVERQQGQWMRSNIGVDQLLKGIPEAQKKAVLLELKQEQPGASQGAQNVQKFLSDFYHKYAKRAMPGVRQRKNFFPRIYDQMLVARKRADFVQTLMGHATMDIVNPDGSKTKEPVDRMTAEAIAESILTQDGFGDIDLLNDAVLPPSARSAKQRSLSFDAAGQAAIAQFTSQDLDSTLYTYLHQMIKRAEFARRFDRVQYKPNGTIGRIERGKKFEMLVDMARAEGASGQQIKKMRESMQAYMGRLHADIDPRYRQAMSLTSAAMNTLILPLSVLSQFVDGANPIIRSNGSLKSAWKGMREAIRAFKDPNNELRYAAEVNNLVSMSAASDVVTERLNSPYLTEGVQKYHDKFFRYTLVTPFMNLMRLYGLGTGREWISQLAKKNDAESRRLLKELGTTPAAVQTWEAQGRPATVDNINDDVGSVITALNRFVDESVFRPNASQRPVWASSPYFMLVWHLKQFMWSFGKIIVGRMAKEVAAQPRLADKMKVVAPMVLMVPLAMLGMAIRDELKYGLGRDAESPSEDDDAWEKTMTIISRTGALGPLQLLLDAQRHSEWGGQLMFSLMGPTFTLLEDQYQDFDPTKMVPGLAMMPEERKMISNWMD